MSTPHLPPEILDHIVDLLHDDQNALGECCLVSKSWISRTRKHIFADIRFDVREALESWKGTFPDPSTSPAHYTKTLHVSCLRFVVPADAGVGGWIRGFSRVVNLEFNTRYTLHADELAVFLTPFHGLSPAVKTLRVDFAVLPPWRIFNFILTFPLLEDLTLIGDVDNTSIDNDDDPNELLTAIRLSSPPAFDGSLELPLNRGTRPIAHRLLFLQGGIHFRKLVLVWHREDEFSLAVALLEKCPHTLESLDITRSLFVESSSPPIDLSKIMALKDVTFRLRSQSVEWITMALKTITPGHHDLRQITIYPSYYVIRVCSDAEPSQAAHGQWLDLDHLLVQFWESRSIRPRMICAKGDERKVWDILARLLLETIRRGIMDPVLVLR